MSPAPPGFDPTAEVVYAPIRHHSPACARAVRALIREHRPDAVLIEGPRDATPILPLLLHPKAAMPLAIYTTYVERAPVDLPGGLGVRRHAAYAPFCAYSPELVAAEAAAEVGAEAALIDLTYPEMVVAGRAGEPPEGRGPQPDSLMSDRHLTHGRFLAAACERANARDADDLWDSLFESGPPEATDPARFFAGVWAYCEAARASATPEELAADGTLTRERAMVAAVAERAGQRLVVVTGGFHSVVLAETEPGMPKPVKAKPDDAVTVLMRYGFRQLDRLNGYASGMPSPGFYQHAWGGGDAAELYAELGRKLDGIGVADVIAAADQCRRLAGLRGHATATREDFLDGVRSSLVKGEVHAEGGVVLAETRKLLAGDRIGTVPPGAGQPPIVHDFLAAAARLKLDATKAAGGRSTLDLYRQARHRAVSRFLHRLRFLNVPFGEWEKGPDFVKGKELGRIQELWSWAWTPAVEGRLIECSVYGGSVEEAAAGRLSEAADEAEHGGGGAAEAASLVLEACRMGLHAHAPGLLERTRGLVAREGSFEGVVAACERLLLLHVAVEPLEAHGLAGVLEAADAAYARACRLLDGLGGLGDGDEEPALVSLRELAQAAATLGDDQRRRGLRVRPLERLAAESANDCIAGAALGLLHAAGERGDAEAAAAFRGRLGEPEAAAAFLRGLLATDRAALWLVPGFVDALHGLLRDADQDLFETLLPRLRLAMAELSPTETDRVAAAVAEHAGVARFRTRVTAAEAATLAERSAVERRVAEALERDGLADWLRK